MATVTRRTLCSEADASGQRISEHYPVAHEAVQGIFEGGRSVLLEEEMPDPGKAVTGHRQGQQQPGIGTEDGPGQQDQYQQAAAVVQTAADIVAVFAEIEG